jgi:Zn finger protein HypA/HybF involved in hydrogenase expression
VESRACLYSICGISTLPVLLTMVNMKVPTFMSAAWLTVIVALLLATLFVLPQTAFAQENDDCYMCHEDRELTGTINNRSKSMFVNSKIVTKSVHGEFDCVICHLDIDPEDLPHEDELEPVDCGTCHGEIQEKHSVSLHGKAIKRGDRLAPSCKNCHGTHNVLRHDDPKSPVRASNIPYLCGSCHSEGSNVQKQRTIHQDHMRFFRTPIVTLLSQDETLPKPVHNATRKLRVCI